METGGVVEGRNVGANVVVDSVGKLVGKAVGEVEGRNVGANVVVDSVGKLVGKDVIRLSSTNASVKLRKKTPDSITVTAITPLGCM